jgi:hypothetical protein
LPKRLAVVPATLLVLLILAGACICAGAALKLG